VNARAAPRAISAFATAVRTRGASRMAIISGISTLAWAMPFTSSIARRARPSGTPCMFVKNAPGNL
jgi:hypothetical protein